jgi:hypothetical protein
MATVSLDVAMAGGTAIVAVKRMAQSANDRCKDDLIGKKKVNYVRRFQLEAQDDETKSACR